MTKPAEIDLSVLPPEVRAAFEAERARRLVLEAAVAAAEEAKTRASATPSASRPARTGVKRNQGRLPEELPRIERVIEPASTLCPCGCGEMARIGEDRVERLDVIPAQFRALVTIRPKYACRRCHYSGTGARAPDRGRAADRVADRPCAGVQIRRPPSPLSPVADLRPRRDRVEPLDAGGLGRQGRLPPRAHRRAHGRAAEAVDQAVPRRDHGPGARPRPGADHDRLSPGAGPRRPPLVEAFAVWLAGARARVSARSRMGEKLAYFANHWDGLTAFLDDGRVEMDSNAVENLIRPLTLQRKNSLFAGHDEGAANWACIASLIDTCKINGVDPFAYIVATLEAIATGHPQSRIDDLTPWAYAAASSSNA